MSYRQLSSYLNRTDGLACLISPGNDRGGPSLGRLCRIRLLDLQGLKPLLHNHLLNQHFADFAALTADIDTVLGISHAYTLEVIILNRCILVNNYVVNTVIYT